MVHTEQLELPCLLQQWFQQQIVWLQGNNCINNVIKPKIKIIDVSDEVWMWVHWKYIIVRILWNFYSVKTNRCSYLDVPENGLLNRQSHEREWQSMNVSASKIWKESNHTKMYSV